MSLIDSDALVLDSLPYRDKHLIVSLLTPSVGLVRGVLRGARGGKNPRAGATQILSHIHVVAFHARNAEMATLRQVDLRNSSYPLASDLEQATTASVVAELLTTFCPLGEPAPRRFRLGVAALEALLQGIPPAAVVAYCQFWNLVLGGVLPPLKDSGLDEPDLDFLLLCRTEALGKIQSAPPAGTVNWLDHWVRSEADRPLRALDFLRSMSP